jgi:hypothetical protein
VPAGWCLHLLLLPPLELLPQASLLCGRPLQRAEGPTKQDRASYRCCSSQIDACCKTSFGMECCNGGPSDRSTAAAKGRPTAVTHRSPHIGGNVLVAELHPDAVVSRCKQQLEDQVRPAVLTEGLQQVSIKLRDCCCVQSTLIWAGSRCTYSNMLLLVRLVSF